MEYPPKMALGFKVMSAFIAVSLLGGGIIVLKRRHSFAALFDFGIQTTVTASIIMAISMVQSCNGLCCYDTYTCYLKYNYVCLTDFERAYCTNWNPPLSVWLMPICILYGFQLVVYAWSSLYYLEFINLPRLAGSWNKRFLIKRRPNPSYPCKPCVSYVALAVVLNLKHTYNVFCASPPVSDDAPIPVQAQKTMVFPSQTNFNPCGVTKEPLSWNEDEDNIAIPSAPLRPHSVDEPSSLIMMAHATVISLAETAEVLQLLQVKYARQYQCLKCLWYITYVPEGSAVLVCPQCLTTWSAP